MSISIEKVFNHSRFVNGPSLFFLILYLPVGLLLFTVRIFISLQLCLASLILPAGTYFRNYVLRILYSVLGIVVRERDCHKKAKDCRIIVSNHITPFDHLAIALVNPCVSVNVYNLPGPLSAILNYKEFGIARGKEVLKSNIQEYITKPDTIPLILHPEGASTNGSLALMKYGSWAFEMDSTVLVIGLKVHRLPVLQIAPSVLGGSWAADLFYMLFSPVTIFTVRYVDKLVKEDTEGFDAFALRAQKATASALGIEISNHTVVDKIEYVKRLAREEAAASNPFFSPEIHGLALQVKEVLPYLPLDIIKRDLVRTRNVDVTITNFLEGTIPEPIPTGSPATSGTQATASSSPSRFTPPGTAGISSSPPTPSTPSFSTDAYDRMASFHERKKLFIEKARETYIKKYNLKVPGYDC